MGSRCLAMRVRVLSSLFSFIVVQERREGGGREREREGGGEREGERERESQTLVFIWAAGATRLGQTPSVWVTRVLSK